MLLNPMLHAERVTGRKQSTLIDLWSTTGFAAAISDVTGPHVYEFGELPIPTVAITLYDVRRHVLIENGSVQRDAPVRAGRFRIGPPACRVVVDAVPAVHCGKLLLLYLGQTLLKTVGEARATGRPIELMAQAWETEDPWLALSARRLVEICARGEPLNTLLAEQIAYTLVLHLSDRYAKTLGRGDAVDSPHLLTRGCERVVESVRDDPCAPVTVASMAAVAGVSPSSLIRHFKRTTGRTPYRFVMEQRILAARRLLETSDLPITEIALSVGFSSQSHFGAAFRELTGTSPARYRQLQGRRW